MANRHVKYLLVGGGIASSAAADAIRQIDQNGSVLLIAQERSRPYHRPPLSKSFLRGQTPREALFTTPRGWFEQNRVELRTGRRVARLDPGRHHATLDNGEEISYGRLLLAMGASPAPLDVPGATLPNLYYLRTIEDEERLRHAVEKALAEGLRHPAGRGRAVIVGGGLLGVELAGSLTRLGLGVDLIADPHPWSRIAGESTGRFLGLYLQKQGISVHARQRPLRLEGDGRVQRVILTDNTSLDCDFCIAAVGAAANREILRGTSIEAERAVLTDSFCRTNVPDVFAAGDCAAIFDPLFEKYRWIDQWEHAAHTGALAGRNMAGATESYSAVNRFESESMDLRLVGWGEARFVDRRLLRGTPDVDAPAFAEIGIAADGRVSQVLWIGARGGENPSEGLKALVAGRTNVNGLEERLKDPTVPLDSTFGA